MSDTDRRVRLARANIMRALDGIGEGLGATEDLVESLDDLGITLGSVHDVIDAADELVRWVSELASAEGWDL